MNRSLQLWKSMLRTLLTTWFSVKSAQWTVMSINYKKHLTACYGCSYPVYINVKVSNIFQEFSWIKEWSSLWGFNPSFNIQRTSRSVALRKFLRFSTNSRYMLSQKFPCFRFCSWSPVEFWYCYNNFSHSLLLRLSLSQSRLIVINSKTQFSTG